jgi:cell division protease FtsH
MDRKFAGKKMELPGKTPNGNGDRAKRPMRKFEVRMNFNLRTILAWFLVLFFLSSVFFSFQGGSMPNREIAIGEALNQVEEGRVEKLEADGERVIVHYKDSDEVAYFMKEPQDSLVSILEKSGIDPKQVEHTVLDQSVRRLMRDLLGTGIPLLVTILFVLFIFRQARGAQDSLFSFGQSKAKLFAKGKQSVKFSDVAGVDEAKKELEEIVDFLKNPGKYKAVGARTPKGALLVGPSGVGKTLLARAVAGEAAVPFFSMAGSEFMEMLVGVGSARVRDLFATAKKSAPSIIFIDEIDAIGRQRGNGMMGGHDEREQTLNQILVEMDGFTPNDNVVVLAATNRGDLLDPALLRPGRFDRRVVVELPDIEGRKAILGIYARNKPLPKDISWDAVARRTVGFSGADIENMLNEAAIQAARENRKIIDMKDIEEAATKVKLGPQKRRLQSEEDRRMTAYHEVGHAIATWAQPGMDTVHRISIVSRGMTLGHTLVPPSADRVHETKSRLLAQIAMMLGGRAAEEMVFGEFTTGASNDIDKATMVARNMVTEYGMSPLGAMNFGPQRDVVDWGKTFYEQSPVSQEMQAKIDAEVKKILDEGYIKSLDILKKHRKQMDVVVERLMKVETMDGEEFEKLMGAKDVEKKKTKLS